MTSLAAAEILWQELSSAIEGALSVGTQGTKTVQHSQRFLELIHFAVQNNRGKNVSLHMRESLFVHNGVPLADASIRGRATIAFLRFAGAGGLMFTPDTSFQEVLDLVDLARGICEGEDAAFGDARDARLQKLPNITLLEPSDNVTWDWIDDGPAGAAYESAGFSLESAAPARREVATAVEDAMTQAAAGTAVEMNAARTVSESVIAAGHTGFDNLMQLAERPEFDVFTVQHSLRVSLLATYVASELGASRELMTELGAAAMFHDVGKGRIPEEILYKPGRLNEDERRIIATHPQLGTEILLDSPSVSACALGAAWGHHLRYDGRGYPTRRKWFESTQATSLIQVCDVFEALTARRPYKAPYTPARAFQILFSDAGAYDPAVLATFTRAMGLFPPGRFVLLSDGRLGRVSKAGKSLDRPIVRAFPQGDVIDLAEPMHKGLTVLRLLEEPEFVQFLMTCENGVVDLAATAELAQEMSDSPDTDSAGQPHPKAPLPAGATEEANVEDEARDEEVCGPGDDDSCRLC